MVARDPADLVADAFELQKVSDPHTEPYKSKYESSSLLREARLALSASERSNEEGTEDAVAVALLACQEVQIRDPSPPDEANFGLILCQTDLAQEGRSLIDISLKVLETNAVQRFPGILQAAWNVRGTFLADIGEPEQSEEMLRKAEALFLTADRAQAAGEPSPSALEGGGEHGLVGVVSIMRSKYGKPSTHSYATTVLALAQVYQALGSKDKSARYSAATLNAQLRVADEEGSRAAELNGSEWLQNCAALAGFFASEHAFPLAHRCLQACDAMRGKMEEEGATPDEDVEANVHLAWGRVILLQLEESARRRVMADPPDADSMSERRFGASESLEPSPSGRTISVGADDSLPELLRFHQLQHWMASDEDLPWGESWLATQFDGARDLFNEAIRRLNRAMGYYVLDGHVTEHFTIKMDVSNLYRLLAVFEEDPKRIVAMHKRRIKALEDVIRDLSQVHFPGIFKSCHLEMASSHRSIMAMLARGTHAEVKHAQQAAAHYSSYISFASPSSPTEKMSSAEEETILLRTRLELARVLQHTATSPTDKIPMLQQGIEHLEWTLAYAKNHDVKGLEDELALGKEMLALLQENVRLSRGS